MGGGLWEGMGALEAWLWERGEWSVGSMAMGERKGKEREGKKEKKAKKREEGNEERQRTHARTQVVAWHWEHGSGSMAVGRDGAVGSMAVE